MAKAILRPQQALALKCERRKGKLLLSEFKAQRFWILFMYFILMLCIGSVLWCPVWSITMFGYRHYFVSECVHRNTITMLKSTELPCSNAVSIESLLKAEERLLAHSSLSYLFIFHQILKERPFFIERLFLLASLTRCIDDKRKRTHSSPVSCAPLHLPSFYLSPQVRTL